LIERGHQSASLYASAEWRHVFVNLFLTISPAFLHLKDLRRKRLAGELTRLQPAPILDKSGKNSERGASPSAAPQPFRAARGINFCVRNIFNGFLRVPVKKKNPALNRI
jgi:hypothetical protein